MAEKYPESNKAFCNVWGSKTIVVCPSCDAKIKGRYSLPGIVDFGAYEKSAFCDNCGKPYPWTEKAQEAADALISFSEDLSQEEKKEFKESITDLITESPKTNVAIVKFKTFAKKAGKDIAGGIKDIIIDLVSETAKKAIWGG